MRFRVKFRRLLRSVYAALALAMTAIGLLPILTPIVSANQVEPRSITISNSNASATSVSYNVVFTPGTTTTVGGIVVDICANDPIVGDTSCTYPAGFTWGSATPSLTVNSGMGTGWTD